MKLNEIYPPPTPKHSDLTKPMIGAILRQGNRHYTLVYETSNKLVLRRLDRGNSVIIRSVEYDVSGISRDSLLKLLGDSFDGWEFLGYMKDILSAGGKEPIEARSKNVMPPLHYDVYSAIRGPDGGRTKDGDLLKRLITSRIRSIAFPVHPPGGMYWKKTALTQSDFDEIREVGIMKSCSAP